MKLNPMETAPRDGTQILVWDEPGRWLICNWSICNWDGRTEGWCIAEAFDENFKYDTAADPVGWLPLPPEPQLEIVGTLESNTRRWFYPPEV